MRAGADLFLDGVTVNGNLTVQEDGFVSSLESNVTGRVALNSAYGGYFEGSSVGGATNATTSGFLYTLDSSHGGNVRSDSGETFLQTAVVGGSVNTTGDLLTDMYDSTISGNFVVTGADLGSVVCTSEVDGNANLTGNQFLVQIGADAPLSGCGFNVFGGNVNLIDNVADIVFSTNVVRGSLNCSGNDPAPTGADNRLRGGATGQCAELAAPTALGARGAVAEAEERAADTLAKVEARSARGEQAAAKAGTAQIG